MANIAQSVAATRINGNNTYTNICSQYMMKNRFATNKSIHTKADDINYMMTMAQKSVPILCRLLTANLANLFDSIEMVQYFSVLMLNEIKKYDENTDFNVITQTRSLTEEKSNVFMTTALEANLNISSIFWARLQSNCPQFKFPNQLIKTDQNSCIRLLNCKSDILYRPANCIQAADFSVFDKSTMKSTYGIDYSALETHFSQKWDNFSIIASSTLTPQLTDSNAIMAMKHFMHRANLVVAFEPSVAKLGKILKGMGLSKLHAKQRCSDVFFFSSSCVRKNLVSVIPPCSGDTRDSGSDMTKMQCTISAIYVLSNMTSWVTDTVFQKIGREMNDNPKITSQVYHWSFYDENREPMITT